MNDNHNTIAPAGVVFSTAQGINDAAQIAAATVNNEAVRVMLHPDWEGGDGNWSDAAHWHFARNGANLVTLNLVGGGISGLTTVSGVVINQTGGQVNISGAGAPQAIFWDNFTNNGSVNVTTGATATCFWEGKIDFLSSTIDMELGGTTPGTEHDKIIFSDPVAIANAILNVQYWGGWTASGGDVFDLFDWNGAQSERFASVLLPALSQGLFWNTDMLYTSGELSVATPAPPAVVLLGTGLMGVIGFGRRRLKASMAMERDRG